MKQDGENKSTPFHPKPYTVVDKAGNSLGIESSAGSRYKRNVTYIKEFREQQGKGTGFNHFAEIDAEFSLPGADLVIKDGAIDLEQSPTCNKSPTKSRDTPSTPSSTLTRPTSQANARQG